jgi:hypothetical protein
LTDTEPVGTTAPHPTRYAATRVKVEPRATLEQAVEIRRVLEKMGEKMARMAE